MAHMACEAGAPWWADAVFYQVYPRSFADSDGDGVGDLPGITARLDHIRDLGVDAVWLSPFYPSPQADAGYDVSNYRDVDRVFGTLDDFDALLARAHGLGLRVVVDLVPNHTSDEHRWFAAALAAAPGSPERARYMFRDGRGENGDEPPNNWLSKFGGSAWTRVTEPDGRPGQWYLHLFDTKQPDLNWSNDEVRQLFRGTLRFWLDRGVDGFRVDVAHGLVKDPALPDFHNDGAGTHRLEDLDHGITGASDFGPMWDQPGVHEIYRSWHEVLAGYPGDRVLVAEAWVEPPANMAAYVRPDEMSQAFNFPYLRAHWTPASLRGVIDRSYAAFDAVGAPCTWVLSNHDVVRHASRLGYPTGSEPWDGVGPDDPQPDRALGLRRARAATLLMLALPGSSYLFQGEELGLPEHTTLPADVRQDPTWRRTEHTVVGRDGCRVPLPWRAAEPAFGFSPTGAAWLPQPDDWASYAVDAQLADDDSTLHLYKAALRLRRERALGRGGFAWEASGDPAQVLAFRNGTTVVVTNFGPGDVDLPAGDVLLASGPLPGARLLGPDQTVWLGVSDI